MYKKRLKDFSTLFLGNISAQIVAFALYPSIARLYSPDDFSEFGYITSLTMLLGVFATGQLHSAILNPESEEDAKKLIGTSCSLVFFFSCLVFFYSLVFNKSLVIVSLYVFLYSLYEIQKMVLIRRKLYTSSSLNQLTFRVSGNALKLSPFFFNLKSMGLIFSEISSLSIVLAYGLKTRVFNFTFDKAILKSFWRFPVVQTFTVALTILVSDFPIMFWKNYFPSEEIGYFVMGQRLLITPALVFSLAVQNSSVHHYLKSKEKIFFYFKSILLTSSLGVAASLFIYFFGDILFRTFLGSKWIDGTFVFQWISILLIFKFGSLITQSTFVLKNEVKAPFILRIIQLIILFWGLHFQRTFREALFLYIALDIFIEIVLIFILSLSIYNGKRR